MHSADQHASEVEARADFLEEVMPEGLFERLIEVSFMKIGAVH